MESKNQRYEPGLDHIRAFAACWIVLYHSFQIISAKLAYGTMFNPNVHWLVVRNPLLALLTEGHSAVGLFMVLSGFILARAAIGFEVSYWKFIQNRVLRIYPMFIVIVFVGVASSGSSASFLDVLALLLPLGTTNYASALGPFGDTLWAIPVEFQFYLLFPFLILILTRDGSIKLWQMILLAILFRVLIISFSGDIKYVAYATIVGRIDEFLLGMIAAQYAHQRAPVSRWLILPVIINCIGLLFFYNQVGGYTSQAPWKIIWPTVEGMMWAIFILAYLSVCRGIPNRISSFICAIGVVSFSIYLLHFTVLRLAVAAISSLYLVVPVPQAVAVIIGMLIVLSVSILISRLSFAAIEQPFLRMRVRYLRVIGTRKDER